jgi:choline-sulfatase
VSALRAWGQRFGQTALGAAVGGLGVAAIDASYAADKGALATTWVADLGLVATLTLPVAGVVSAALIVARPGSPFALGRVRAELTEPSEAGGFRRGFLGLSLAASGVFLAVAADLGRATLAATTDAKVAGASLAGTLVATAVVLGMGAHLLARKWRKRLAKGFWSRHPLALAALGFGVAAAIVAHGVYHGSVGGEGGMLGVFGVLKRDELDLRGVGLLALLAVSAVLGEATLFRVPGLAALSAAILPLAFTSSAAFELDNAPTVAASLERAPLGKLPLALLRRITDKDHDGKARTFGGGDCNDRDASIYPGAVDLPGNGVDEDCSGSDLQLPVTTPESAEAAAKAKAAKEAAVVPEKLNVLLITVDTLRADLGFAGNPRPVSPRLDELAKKSVVFDNAYSLASYTGKSIGPLMSGKYPSETHRGWSHFNTYGKEDTMVAERLSAAGIKTQSVQAHWYFEKCCGLARGFDKVDLTAMPAGLGADADTGTSGQKLTDNAIKMLSDDAFTGDRFFGWVHYLDPHADYVKHPTVPDFGKQARDTYDGEVAFVDQQIGRLLDFIAEKPWGKHTVIIVTSDHGEAFGEHKLIRHGFEIWEELVRVPLLIYAPTAQPHHIKARRSGIDLVPTLLDLYGVKMTNKTPDDFVSGESLVPEVFGAPGAEVPARAVFVDMPAGPNNQERRALYEGDKKLYVQAGQRFMLFDLANDPGETKDLAPTDKEGVAEMRNKYDAFRAKLHEVVVRPQ